ncbi:putative membrane protein [Streptococcus criceti HS-6]|uniref:Membrane protein n=2 Tax=Streptococcus criceti TaxID=1333 RepID=G5JP28_STRCG|nr:putative membrane protein [Streptococcus criceti HS-6]
MQQPQPNNHSSNRKQLDNVLDILRKLWLILKETCRMLIKYLKFRASDPLKVFLVALLISLIYIIPLMMSNGALYGDDLHFHLNRVLSLASIHETPVNFKAFYKVGQGVNFFYPYLTYYPYYLLYRLTGSLYSGWILYIYGLTAVTYLISYYSGKGITHNPFSSHIFAIFYVFSAYRLGNIVIRFATGEVIAMSFLPLAFYGLYNIVIGNYHKWYPLTFGMALLIYSHILTAFMASAVVGLIFITTIAFQQNRLQRCWNFFIAVMASLALSAFQFFTMLEQFRYSRIDNPGGISLNDSTRTLGDIFHFSLNNAIKELVPGILVIVCLLLILLQFRKLRIEDYYLIGWIVLLILLESKVIKWPDSPNSSVSVIQFAWRVNSFLTLFATFLASKLFLLRNPSVGRRRLFYVETIAVLVALSAINISSSVTIFKTLSSHKPIIFSELSHRNKQKRVLNAISLRDYANRSTREKNEVADTGKKLGHQVIVKDSDVLLESKFRFRDSYATGVITNDTGSEQRIELPFYRYKGQVVTVDGQEVPTTLSKAGATTIHFPEGTHEIKITYHYTQLARVAWAASVISCLSIILYAIAYGLADRGILIFRKDGLVIYHPEWNSAATER